MFPAPPPAPAPRLPAADCSPATSVIRELRPGSEVSCIAPYALHGSQHDRLPLRHATARRATSAAGRGRIRTEDPKKNQSNGSTLRTCGLLFEPTQNAFFPLSKKVRRISIWMGIR